MRRIQLLPIVLLAACATRGAVFDSGDEGEAATATSTSQGEAEAGSEGEAESAGDLTGMSSQTVTCGFIGCGDDTTWDTDTGTGGVCDTYCDVFAENDCPRGQKCTAVGCEVGISTWDTFGCVDIMGAQDVGEPCQQIGDGYDGEDDCVAGGMCLWVDADTGLGTCAANCTGSFSAPECAPGSTCVVPGDAVPVVCVPHCDLLAQDCAPGELCLPLTADVGSACTLDASGGAGYGAPCGFANSCSSGNLCIEGARVPEAGCEAGASCCSPMCDLFSSQPCPGAGQFCLPLFEPGDEPFGQENVGVCALPEMP